MEIITVYLIERKSLTFMELAVLFLCLQQQTIGPRHVRVNPVHSKSLRPSGNVLYCLLLTTNNYAFVHKVYVCIYIAFV